MLTKNEYLSIPTYIVTLLSLAKSRHGLACPELKQVNFPVEIAFAIVGLIWEAL